MNVNFVFQQTKVFVGSLPQGSKPEDLRKLFERFGVVTECDIMNRCGFVHMQSEEQATAAIRALDTTMFNGGVITVERGRIKERGARGGVGGRGMRGARGAGRGGPARWPGGAQRGEPYNRDQRPMRGGGAARARGGGGGGRGAAAARRARAGPRARRTHQAARRRHQGECYSVSHFCNIYFILITTDFEN